MKRSLLALMMIASAAVLATGCTEAQPPRSFVQPNALRKADFTGTWYYNATVTDAPPTNGVFFEGEYGELQKIKWVVTEDTLFAVRAYPWVYGQEATQTPGSPHGNPDGDGTGDRFTYEGAPLAAWHITSHFDIIRDYNPSTGEETNRIIESQERPWNEREYMRVDWSQNQVPDYTGVSGFWLFNDVNITNTTYTVTDPTSPDAMHVERANDSDVKDLGFSTGEMNYLDVTDQLIAGPNEETFVIDDQGSTMTFPSCFLYYATEDCAAQKVKIKHSFAKMAPKSSYEKRAWDGTDQNLFGFFTTSLLHFWDPHYGDTYTGAKRYAERFNFYKQSCVNDVDANGNAVPTTCEAPHRVRDPNPADPNSNPTWLTKYTDQYGAHIPESIAVANPTLTDGFDNVDSNGNPIAVPDDEFYWVGTNGVALSVPDKGGQHWSFNPQTGLVTYADGSTTHFDGDSKWIAPADRQGVRTIPYYANTEMPEDIWQASQEVIREWNNVFKTAYKDETGKDADADIFVWCHNPVHVGSDPAACQNHLKPKLDADGNVMNGTDGQPILEVRQGDPRYSMILWLGQYQAGGPLGLGPAMADPESGETISAKANIYGGELDIYAAQMRDVVLLQEQRLSPEAYTTGLNVAAGVENDHLGAKNVDAWVKFQHGQKPGLGMPHAARTQDQIKAQASLMDFSYAKSATLGPVDMTNSRTLLGSLTQREQRLGGLFGTSTGDLMQAKLDTLRGTPAEAMLATPELLMNAGLSPRQSFTDLPAAEKSIYSPLNTPRLHDARKEFIERMETFGFDFEPFSYSVIQGETERYANMAPADIEQDLRKRIYIAVTLHEVGHNMGLRHNFRATWDAMNYFPGYWTQRDAAAVALTGAHKLYARSNPNGTVQPNELSPQQVPTDVGPAAVTGYNPGPVSSFGQQYSSIMDYGAAFNTDTAGLGRYDIASIKYGYANNVEVFTDAKTTPASLDRLASLQVFQGAYGFPSPLLVTGNNFAAVNYYTYPDMMNSGVDGLQKRADVNYYSVDDRQYAPSSTVSAALDSNGDVLPVVPYYFCSDEFVGNLSCQRFDFGADAYEQASDLIQRYWNYYILNNFKRDKYSFHTFGLGSSYAGYIYDRYFEILRDQMTWYVLLRSDYTNFSYQYNGGSNATAAVNQINQFLSDDENGWGSFTAAINDGFQLIGDVLTAPQAGSFYAADDGLGNPVYKQVNDTLGTGNLDVDITEGRYEGTSWNYAGCGYYWGDECQSRIGYFVDKWLAMRALSDSTAYFTGRDTSIDVRQYQIGYWLPYKNQILDLYGAMFANNTTKLAPYVLGAGEGLARYDFTNGAWHADNGAPVPAPTGSRLDPELGFSAQMWSGVFGMAGFNSTFDQGFIDATRIFVVGNGEAPVPDSQLMNADGTPGPLATDDPTDVKGSCNAAGTVCGTKDWLIWTDPNTTKTYAAHSAPPVIPGCDSATLPLPQDPNGANPACTSNKPVRQDLAVRMLEHAKALNGRIAYANANPTVEDRDVARNNYNQFVQNLDMMRSLHNWMGYGVFIQQ